MQNATHVTQFLSVTRMSLLTSLRMSLLKDYLQQLSQSWPPIHLHLITNHCQPSPATIVINHDPTFAVKHSNINSLPDDSLRSRGAILANLETITTGSVLRPPVWTVMDSARRCRLRCVTWWPAWKNQRPLSIIDHHATIVTSIVFVTVSITRSRCTALIFGW